MLIKIQYEVGIQVFSCFHKARDALTKTEGIKRVEWSVYSFLLLTGEELSRKKGSSEFPFDLEAKFLWVRVDKEGEIKLVLTDQEFIKFFRGRLGRVRKRGSRTTKRILRRELNSLLEISS